MKHKLAKSHEMQTRAKRLIPGLNPTGVPRDLSGTAFPFHYNQLKELEGLVAAHGPERIQAVEFNAKH